MRPIGVPTLLSFDRLSGAVSLLRGQAATARNEVTTGRIENLPAHLGAATGDAQLLKRAAADISLRRDMIARAELRGSVVQETLASLQAASAGMHADVAAAVGRGDETAVRAAGRDAAGSLDTAIARLNSRVEGGALFAGDASRSSALAPASALIADISAIFAAAPDSAQLEADLEFYFNDPNGGFATNIYLGGTGDLYSIEIAPGERVGVTARADAAPFKDTLRGLAVAAIAGSAPQSAKRDEALAAAGQLLSAASDGVTALRAGIGVEEKRTADARARLEAEETALAAAYNERTARDPFEAASRLTALEAQLEASYAMTARLSRLSLASYI
jgi:flagellar hook-associated protein 3 FlgL